MFRKSRDDWQGINDDVNFVQHKKNRFKWNKLLALLAALLLALAAAGTGGYFVVETMINALNFDDFKTPDVDLEGADFRVNMAEVPITSSDQNLRLDYFESTLKTKAFDYLSKLSWWKLLFSSNPNNFDFTWYKSKSDVKLGPLDVARDGIDPCDLVITVKNSGYSFRINVGSFIYNNAKFYENFMIFNRFESMYENINPSPQEIVNKGYLSRAFSIKVPAAASYNEEVYDWIQERIELFSNNEKQEINTGSTSAVMYPILTNISNLTDIDLTDPNTLINYLPLLSDTNNTYYDKIGNYKKIQPNSTFSIIYSPIPDLIEKIKKAGIPSDISDLDKYLKDLNLTFVPFVENNKGVDVFNNPKTYSTIHKLIENGALTGDPETMELTRYFYNASNTININDFKFMIISNNFTNIKELSDYLTEQVWNLIYNKFITCKDFVSLEYPDPNPDTSFNIVTASLASFKNYINTAFNNDPNIGKITYYDQQNNILALNDTDVIPKEKIKHFSITFGPQRVTTTPYNSQSFSFFFKTFWI